MLISRPPNPLLIMLHSNLKSRVLFVNNRYTYDTGKRNGSCGRKTSDPNPATVTAGRVAGLHLVYLTKFSPFGVLPLRCSAILTFGEEMFYFVNIIRYRFFLFWVVASITVALTTGCDQARQEIANAIKPVTIEDVIVTVNENVRLGKFKEAQTEGEAFLAGKEDSSGRLAWELAKACAQSGELDLAIKYVSQALKANAVNGPQAMVEPLLEPIRTDLRFVSLLVGIGVAQSPPTNSRTHVEAEKNPSTAITMGAQGIEVKAGDIVIKLPN